MQNRPANQATKEQKLTVQQSLPSTQSLSTTQVIKTFGAVISTPQNNKNIVIKKEPQEDKVSHHPITKENIINAAYTLRGNSTATANCAFLSADVLKFLETHIQPTAPTKRRHPAKPGDFTFTFEDEPFIIKREPGDTSKQLHQVGRITVLCNDHGPTALIPPDISAREKDDIIYAEQEIIDFTQFEATRCNYRELGKKLREDAKINNQAKYGYLILASAGSSDEMEQEKYLGHVVTYYVTPEYLYFIDCHNISKGKLVDPAYPAVFSDLTKGYRFAGSTSATSSKSVKEEVYGENIFYIPTGSVSLALAHSATESTKNKPSMTSSAEDPSPAKTTSLPIDNAARRAYLDWILLSSFETSPVMDCDFATVNECFNTYISPNRPR
ncbi:MAG: hypothetical protein ABI597_00510 [Gammaproteobacteria bacterium]